LKHKYPIYAEWKDEKVDSFIGVVFKFESKYVATVVKSTLQSPYNVGSRHDSIVSHTDRRSWKIVEDPDVQSRKEQNDLYQTLGMKGLE